MCAIDCFIDMCVIVALQHHCFPKLQLICLYMNYIIIIIIIIIILNK